MNSSSLVRLLAEFARPAKAASPARPSEGARRAGAGGDSAAAESKQSFAEQLGLWLDWTDAIALAAALTRDAAAHPVGGRSAAASPAKTAADEVVRVRRTLADAILADEVFKAGQQKPNRLNGQPPPTGAALAAAPEFSVYRRACLAHQRAMVAGLAPLRSQVRRALATLSPALGRLAALDAVFDEALGERERHLLAAVPRLLEQHFEHVCLAHAATVRQAPASPAPVDAAPPAPWLADYGRVVQQVLLAELDVRLQPIEGMVEAMGHGVTRLQ